MTSFFFYKRMVPGCKPEWNREATTVFSRLPSLRRLQATPPLQISLPRRPSGSYKKYQGRIPEIFLLVFWMKLIFNEDTLKLTDFYLTSKNEHCLWQSYQKETLAERRLFLYNSKVLSKNSDATPKILWPHYVFSLLRRHSKWWGCIFCN